MSVWTKRRAERLILMVALLAIVLVLVLPQVDLPDVVLHRGGAPVVAQARAYSAPTLLSLRIPVRSSLAAAVSESGWERSSLPFSTSRSLLVLHQSLRC